MITQNNYLFSTEQGIEFKSINEGNIQRHEIIGWKINEDDAVSPILFPAPAKNATIIYRYSGMPTVHFNLQTGESYRTLEMAMEAHV